MTAPTTPLCRSTPRYLTEDSTIEELMWRYILWFYNQMNTIYSPSASTAAELSERGLNPEKIRTFPRGVDLHRFNPAKRNGYLETHYKAPAGLKLLYVGRVSKEKNLQMLVRSFITISESRPDVHMVVVGDGPYLEEMRQALAEYSCIFTGYLDGEDLAAVYASSDLFVFPSTTDTFGNVVLEAQASGIPVIVTDAGGPQENMLDGHTGMVVKADDEEGFTQAIVSLIDDPVTRRRMSQEARRYIENRSFERAFNATWSIYQGVCRAVGSLIPLPSVLKITVLNLLSFRAGVSGPYLLQTTSLFASLIGEIYLVVIKSISRPVLIPHGHQGQAQLAFQGLNLCELIRMDLGRLKVMAGKGQQRHSQFFFQVGDRLEILRTQFR